MELLAGAMAFAQLFLPPPLSNLCYRHQIAPSQGPRPTTVINYGPTNPNSIFQDSSAKYHLQNIRGVRFYAIDFNHDTWTDLVVLPNYFSVPQFYLFSPHHRYFLPLDYSPFAKKIQASFLTFVDLDRDNTLDLIAATFNQKSELSQVAVRVFQGKNNHGRISYQERLDVFSAKTHQLLKNFPLASLSVLDFNLDGKLDIFLGGWFRYLLKNTPLNSPDLLLQGNLFHMTDQSFRLSKEWKEQRYPHVYPHAMPTFASSTCDIDQDGYPDILTASSNGYPNRLWINQFSSKRGRIFSDFGHKSGYSGGGQDDPSGWQLRGGGHSLFSLCGDYNNDTIMDIFLGELSHLHTLGQMDTSSMLTGATPSFPPQFIRTPYSHDGPRRSRGDHRGSWLDYNNDGLLDLLLDNSGFPPHSRLTLFEQQPDHSYVNRAKELGLDIVNPVGSIVLDINRDGRMDILTGQDRIRDARIKPRLYLFENTAPRRGKRSLRFFLRGVLSNTRGIGAMVTLQTSRGVQRRWVEYHQGAQASQHSEGISFGLGIGEKALRVMVQWPYRGEQGLKQTRHALGNYQFRHFLSLTLCETGQTRRGHARGVKCTSSVP